MEKEGPPSDTSHLSGRSVEDVCGDHGLLPCMCGPTSQIIPGAGAKAEAEAEAEADAQAQADAEAYAAFKEREELEQRPYLVVVCPQSRMKHPWRQGEEPWGECCGVPMTEMMAMAERTRDVRHRPVFVFSVLSARRQQGTCSQVYTRFVPACSPSLGTFYSTGYTRTRVLYPHGRGYQLPTVVSAYRQNSNGVDRCNQLALQLRQCTPWLCDTLPGTLTRHRNALVCGIRT